MHPGVIFLIAAMTLTSEGVRIQDAEADMNDDGSSIGLEGDSSMKHLEPLKLRVPSFALHPHASFDVERELSHWREVNARLQVALKSRVEEEPSSGKDFAAILKKDVLTADRLDRQVQKINAVIQSEPTIERVSRQSSPFDFEEEPFSLIQLRGVTADDLLSTDVVLSDWAYCTCGSGENGTLVFPERDWPGVDLPAPSTISDLTLPSSMLQVTVHGRRMAIRRSEECACENPWENVRPNNECTLNSNVTVCLVRVDGVSQKSSADLQEEANELIAAIDDSFTKSSSTPSINTTVVSPPSILSNVTSSIVNETVTTTSNATNATNATTPEPLPVTAEISTSSNSSGIPGTSLLESGKTSNSFFEIWKPFRFQL